MSPSTVKSLKGLVAWIAVTFAAAAIGSIASLEAGSFYGQLARPGWAPPASVFGPVWTVLYALMAVAAWWTWKAAGSFAAARAPLSAYLVQLALNALWSWLFFAWHLGGAAFADIVLLWLMLLVTIVGFWRTSALAGALMLPYLAWVTFAAFLNLSTWQLNPGQL